MLPPSESVCEKYMAIRKYLPGQCSEAVLNELTGRGDRVWGTGDATPLPSPMHQSPVQNFPSFSALEYLKTRCVGVFTSWRRGSVDSPFVFHPDDGWQMPQEVGIQKMDQNIVATLASPAHLSQASAWLIYVKQNQSLLCIKSSQIRKVSGLVRQSAPRSFLRLMT